MAIDPTLLGVLSLGTMKKSERKRAEEATFLTMVPGPASTRAAFATVAVGTQARDSLRRERKTAAAVMSAVEAIVAGQEPAAAFGGQAALRDLKPEELATRFTDAFGGRGTTGERAVSVPGDPTQQVQTLRNALEQATDMLVEAVGRSKNQLFTPDEAEKYDEYLDLLSNDTRGRIVKRTDFEIDVD